MIKDREGGGHQGTYPFQGKTVIGVVHLKPLPGSPSCRTGLQSILEAAQSDARALIQGGVDGLILENFGDAPFLPHRVEPHTVAAMAMILSRLGALSDLPLGVNVLRNDGLSALGIALAADAQFVRVNVFTGAAVTDQGIIQGNAHELLRYRKSLGLNTAILADVHVKHSAPLGATPIDQAALDAFLRGGADALVVTGRATGAALDLKDLKAVKGAVPEAPVLAGSGVDDENIREILSIADGIIVGTWLKEGGDVHAPVDPDRVSRLMGLAKKE